MADATNPESFQEIVSVSIQYMLYSEAVRHSWLRASTSQHNPATLD